VDRPIAKSEPTAAAAPAKAAKSTPMMTQYLAIKREHPDCLLFYRMGDFYELFFEDAEKAARALDITLTKRGKHLDADIPMCGVPVHSHEAYLVRLIRKGFRVAVCEQTENPAEAKKRGNKSVVRRDVTRVVTAGTLTEDTLLDARRHNFLVACAEAEQRLGLAWIDISTGEFLLQAIDPPALGAALARLDGGEILVSESLLGRAETAAILGDWRDVLTPLPTARFDSANGRKRLQTLFGVQTLDAFGSFSRAETAAGGALVDYIELTQKGRLPRIAQPRHLATGAAMEIDAATRRNLELTATLTGERKGSLLDCLDATITGAGARRLAARLAAPLTDIAEIERRLDAVQFFVDSPPLRDTLGGHLRRCPDIERSLSRLSIGRAGPRDLAAVRDGLELSKTIRNVIETTVEQALPAAIADDVATLGRHPDLVAHLTRALAPEPPVSVRDGNFIGSGYSAELDEFRTLRDESRRLIADLQKRYVTETYINNLKIRHNNMLGYFVEIQARHADALPTGEGSPFIHRQTMANAMRYTTVELGDLEGRIGRAADQALALETEIFERLGEEIVAEADSIAQTARALADLDVASSLGRLAAERGYCRPKLDDSYDIEITSGRHPVVEVALESGQEGRFVANHCGLGGESMIWLLTGPNMAGKSTFLRQNALIAVIAQMGAFVPAESCRMGVVDRLFSRVGAADDLARGRSTFMVEMVETAAILNQAGPRALVILDEIGRGTATYDGLSIAWAVIEHLHARNRCRTLFATHYHELTALAARLENLACHTMRVKEWQDDVVFLHEVAPGAADRSYGIHVGQLAGLPPEVVTRSKQILETLEAGEQSSALTRLADDLPLFAAMPEKPAAAAEPSALEETLAVLHPDEMSPREALEALYRLKQLLDKDG
jgi:DNA mismatch repair protein MutS